MSIMKTFKRLRARYTQWGYVGGFWGPWALTYPLQEESSSVGLRLDVDLQTGANLSGPIPGTRRGLHLGLMPPPRWRAWAYERTPAGAHARSERAVGSMTPPTAATRAAHADMLRRVKPDRS